CPCHRRPPSLAYRSTSSPSWSPPTSPEQAPTTRNVPSSSSTRTVGFSEAPRSVVDTVGLRDFLLVGRTDLLIEHLGAPLGTPRIVYDPDDSDRTDDDTLSEIGPSISYQRKASRDPARDADKRKDALRNSQRLASIAQLHEAGHITVLDL